jgi:hypothetical protein
MEKFKKFRQHPAKDAIELLDKKVLLSITGGDEDPPPPPPPPPPPR